FVPNVLFWSTRNPPVTNSRSRSAKVCSRNVPALTLKVDASSVNGTAPAVVVVAPGGRIEPVAPLRENILRKYWAPNVVFDETALFRLNCAVPLASKV